ncbi:hypothetical protein K438DRAFT_1805733 [Mycena galopus ATCC 62051]|nr:hypothetical protein K438DRAFT_1805733 [Mycena galopus ATCC 62051]
MSLSIDIVPLATSLDISAFSLSGHVSIVLKPSFSVFERRRAARIILQSVLLTFDGQTEVITANLGYSPLRLYTLSRELLASSEPIELSNEDQEQTDEPFKYLVVEDSSATWSFSSLCSPFRPRTPGRSIGTCKSITLRRFVEPPTDEPKPPTLVMASVPTQVDVREDRFPFTLRLRTKDLEDAHCKRLQVSNFTLDVVQAETCRRATEASKYQTRFPIPSQDCQPPNKPLCNAHHMSDMYNLGLFLAPSLHTTSVTCSTSLLPSGETGIFKLTGETRIFANDAETDPETWYTLETTVPFVRHFPSLEESADWEGSGNLRPSTSSPLYDVAHSLKLTVRCEYEMTEGSEPAVTDLTFTLPLQFGRVAPPLPPPDILHSMSLVDGVYPPMPSLLPFGANLPVYSQLFDSRGNRKIDSTPLPLYTPRSSTECPMDPPPFNEKQDELHATTI